MSQGDLLKSYATSLYGQMILSRSGISSDVIAAYLRERKNIVNFGDKESELHDVFTLLELSHKIAELDPEFYQFLFELGVRDREFTGAAEWVERQIKKRKQKRRFWGKVSLGQVPSFGADFAYGAAYALGRFSHDMSREAIGGGSNFHFIYGNEQIKQLEIVLARRKEANAILVGEEGSGKMDVILDFARDIMNGYINPALEHKRVMAFDANAFVAVMKSKNELLHRSLIQKGLLIYVPENVEVKDNITLNYEFLTNSFDHLLIIVDKNSIVKVVDGGRKLSKP